MCVYVCVCVFACAMECVWRSENTLQELVLSFNHVGSVVSGVVRSGGKCLYPLNYFTCPHLILLVSSPQLKQQQQPKPAMVIHIFNSSSQEAEAGLCFLLFLLFVVLLFSACLLHLSWSPPWEFLLDYSYIYVVGVVSSLLLSLCFFGSFCFHSVFVFYVCFLESFSSCLFCYSQYVWPCPPDFSSSLWPLMYSGPGGDSVWMRSQSTDPVSLPTCLCVKPGTISPVICTTSGVPGSPSWESTTSLLWCLLLSWSSNHPQVSEAWRQQDPHDDLSSRAWGIGADFSSLPPWSLIPLLPFLMAGYKLQEAHHKGKGQMVSDRPFVGSILRLPGGSLLWGPEPMPEVESAVSFARSSHPLAGQIMDWVRNMEKFS